MIQHLYQIQMKLTAVTILLLLCVEKGLSRFSDSIPEVLSDDVKLSLSVDPSQNLLYNGAFEAVGVFPRPWKLPNHAIAGWRFTGLMEIGRGYIYNKYWGNGGQIVAELATDHDVTYTKLMKLKPGNYYLEFEWAPREGVRFSSSRIELRWNGDLFTTLEASFDYIYRQAMGFTSRGLYSRLTFTGAGDKEDTLGATISNVRAYETINHFKDGFANFGNMLLHNGFFGKSTFYRIQRSMMLIFDYLPRFWSPQSSEITVFVYDEAILKVTTNNHYKRREFVRLQLSSNRILYTLEFRDSQGRNVLDEMVTNVRVYQQPQFKGKYESLDFDGMVTP